MSLNLTDKITTKAEVLLSLAAFTIGSTVCLSILDYSTLAIGLKHTLSLPQSFHATVGLMTTGFFGYLLGRQKLT